MAHRDRESADDRLALALASGLTVRDAAADAGVSEKTAHRRCGEADFRATVASLRARMLTEAAVRLAEGMTAATSVLRDLLAEGPPDLKFKAAVKLIELAVKVNDAVVLQADVADLKRAVARMTHNPGGSPRVHSP